MAIAFKGKKTLPSIDLNKITCDGDFYLSSSNTYGNSPVSSKNCHFSVKTFDAGNQQIEQTLTDRETGYVYKRILYNSYANAFPASNTSISVPWYVLHGVGKTYASNFIPDSTNSRDLGSSSATWANVYTQNAVTVVSDARNKTDISQLNENELNCAIECGKLYRKYKLIEDSSVHVGVIAQELEACLLKFGINREFFGMLVYDASVDRYMVRYAELNCFINAGFEYRLSQLESK